MKIESINRKVSLTSAEREAIIKSLVSKGIDESLVRGALAAAGDNCPEYGCPHFVCDKTDSKSTSCVKLILEKADPSALLKLKKAMDAKGIKMNSVDPAVAKLFK